MKFDLITLEIKINNRHLFFSYIKITENLTHFSIILPHYFYRTSTRNVKLNILIIKQILFYDIYL